LILLIAIALGDQLLDIQLSFRGGIAYQSITMRLDRTHAID
jgi:hypothetical protein